MKKKDALSEVEALIAHYRPMLGVDPRVKVNARWDASMEDYAEIRQMSRRRVATLSVGKMYVGQSVRDRRQTIIHELLHVAQTDVLGAVHESSEVDIVPDEFYLTFTREHELFTDTLAEVLVDLLPAP